MSNDISNSTSQYKILYSNYGYVKVDESLLSTNAIIPFELSIRLRYIQKFL